MITIVSVVPIVHVFSKTSQATGTIRVVWIESSFLRTTETIVKFLKRSCENHSEKIGTTSKNALRH